MAARPPISLIFSVVIVLSVETWGKKLFFYWDATFGGDMAPQICDVPMLNSHWHWWLVPVSLCGVYCSAQKSQIIMRRSAAVCDCHGQRDPYDSVIYQLDSFFVSLD